MATLQSPQTRRPLATDPLTVDTGVRAKACRQKGWSLLESVIVTALLGMITVVVLSMLDTMSSHQLPATAQRSMERAEDALFGFAMVHFHWPAPLDAVPSPGHPGFIEGWLPDDATGLVTPRPIRYVVDKSLTRTPQQAYRPDPLQLAGGLIGPHPDRNGVDLCMALLVKFQAAAEPASDGNNADLTSAALFKLQTGGDVPSGPGRSTGQETGNAMPSKEGLTALTRGYGEAAFRLRCPQKLSHLAVAVKTTAAMLDMSRLSSQQVEFRRLLLGMARQSVANLEWQQANLAASMSRYSLEELLTVVQLKSTPINLIKGVSTMVTIATAMAAAGISISQTRTSLESAERQVGNAQRKLDLAIQRDQAAQATVRRSAGRASQLLERG